MKKSTLNSYLRLHYRTKLRKIPKEDGGGFVATIPELGKDAFVGDGETKIEALKNLKATKKRLFEQYLREGIEIPLPRK